MAFAVFTNIGNTGTYTSELGNRKHMTEGYGQGIRREDLGAIIRNFIGEISRRADGHGFLRRVANFG